MALRGKDASGRRVRERSHGVFRPEPPPDPEHSLTRRQMRQIAGIVAFSMIVAFALALGFVFVLGLLGIS